ncbi:MAG: hypothetical protein R3B54_02205 [Bdellovibrionota bacterium]
MPKNLFSSNYISKRSFFLIGALLVGATAMGAYSPDKRRGNPGEYDPGPEKGSNFAQLFGSTPNYRAIADHVLGGRSEKFRWQFGPMWYRGRLGKNEAKAFVVGQEGAQDENVSNRAFTGSTGTKTQKFLNHLGLTDQYLILNTFVYTINGQLDHENPKFKWLEQGAESGKESPIVEYRHQLFDEMVRQNAGSLQLVMGVGSGGKASVATWINARGGSCSPAKNLENCDTRRVNAYFKRQGINLKHELLVVGVPHPGGASPSNGGLEALKSIVRGFTDAAKRVAKKIESDKSYSDEWFEGISESKTAILRRLKSEYKYGNAPIPFKDFAFGTNWRMGDQGTTSNRRGSDSIQVFSDKGKYNNDGHTVRYDRVSDNLNGMLSIGGEIRVPGMLDFDLAYEMPKFEKKVPDHVNLYDNGPCGGTRSSCGLSLALQDWPDFESFSVKPLNHESFGHGPIYRGRFAKAKLIVLADQQSQDDFFSVRALTGEAGQHLQRWLEVVGVDEDYAILRTLPIDTLGMDAKDAKDLALEKKVVSARNKIFAEAKKVGASMKVVTLGPVAEAVAKSIEGIEVVAHLDAPDSKNASAWDAAAKQTAKAIGTRTDGKYDGKKLLAIARLDLPAHTRWWMGSTGTRAVRGYGNEEVDGNYYKVFAPKWVTRLKPVPLTRDEEAEIDERMAAADLRGRAAGDAKTTEFIHKDYNYDDVRSEGFKRNARTEDDWEYVVDPETRKLLNQGGISEGDVDALILRGRADAGPILQAVDKTTGKPVEGDVIESEGGEVGAPDVIER